MKSKLEKYIYECSSKGKKLLSLLIDPDKTNVKQAAYIASNAQKAGIDLILYGSSLLLKENFHSVILSIKKNSKLPVIIFPGNHFQIDSNADAILFLSLLSGRNPEFLIGQQILAAPQLKQTKIEILPTAYLLVDGGSYTSANYISNTFPIPSDKTDIAVATCLAAEMLGFKFIYIDTGSGAQRVIPPSMIEAVKKNTSLPLFIGGGIHTSDQIQQLFSAGADILVIGTAFENEPEMIFELTSIVKK